VRWPKASWPVYRSAPLDCRAISTSASRSTTKRAPRGSCSGRSASVHRLRARVPHSRRDDGSTDGTGETLASYGRVLPMTVRHASTRQGYARSPRSCCASAAAHRRPKRDCAITLHADFVHAPETMEEMVKRLESGADLVVVSWPARSARARGGALGAVRPAAVCGSPAVRDSVSGFTALRLIVLRQATRRAPLRRCSPRRLVRQRRASGAAGAARRAASKRCHGPPATICSSGRPGCGRGTQLLATWRGRSVIRAARGRR